MNRFERRVNGFTGKAFLPTLVCLAVFVAGILPSAMAAEPLKVAAVFETPIEEPWVNQIHVALVKGKKELGITYDYSESVKSADFARVMREYAEKGYKLITGDAFGAERIALEAGLGLEHVLALLAHQVALLAVLVALLAHQWHAVAAERSPDQLQVPRRWDRSLLAPPLQGLGEEVGAGIGRHGELEQAADVHRRVTGFQQQPGCVHG